jgi:hypothetical protein
VNSEVERAVDALRHSFDGAMVTVEEDGAGGAYVFIEPVDLGPRFNPTTTWVGGHLTAQTPYSDVYPLFIGANVAWANGRAFSAPVTAGHNFRGRVAIQVSRRANKRDPKLEPPVVKFNKVLHWLRYIA